MDINDFENEVLVRLSLIEQKLASLDQSKTVTYDNRDELSKMNLRVDEIEKKIKAVSSAVVSIVVAVIVAIICYILKI